MLEDRMVSLCEPREQFIQQIVILIVFRYKGACHDRGCPFSPKGFSRTEPLTFGAAETLRSISVFHYQALLVPVTVYYAMLRLSYGCTPILC